jgi:hypothetical protein
VTTNLTDQLRASGRDPAKEARIARDLAQRALIVQDYGKVGWFLRAAEEWESTVYEARRQGLRLVGESVGDLRCERARF